MKNGSLLKLVLGASAITLGLSAFGLANVKPVAKVDAVTSSSSATSLLIPGNTVYLHINTASGSPTYANFSFAFKGTGSTKETLTSSFAALVTGKTRLYSATIPDFANGATDWTQFRAYSYVSGKTIASTASAHTDWVSNTAVNEIVIPYAGSFTGGSAPVETFVYGSDAQALQYWCREQFEYSATDYDCSQIYNGSVYDESKISNMLSSWLGTYSSSYSSLSAGAKTLFKNAVASSTGTTDLIRSVTRYDYILVRHQSYTYNTYRFTNFASRTISGYSGANIVSPSASDSSSTLVLGGLSAVAVIAAGGYFFVRKKKID